MHTLNSLLGFSVFGLFVFSSVKVRFGFLSSFLVFQVFSSACLSVYLSVSYYRVSCHLLSRGTLLMGPTIVYKSVQKDDETHLRFQVQFS